MSRRLRLPNNLLVVTLTIALLSVSAGCKKKEQSPPPPSPTPKAAAAPPKPLQAQQSSAKKVVQPVALFDFAGKKDPFKPYVAPKPQAQGLPQQKGKPADLLPIQSYDVSKFKISGIIVGLKENRALIVDPAGKGYVVKQGMLIGSNNGTIIKITPSYIEVAETYREDNGQVRKRNVRLTLMPKK